MTLVGDLEAIFCPSFLVRYALCDGDTSLLGSVTIIIFQKFVDLFKCQFCPLHQFFLPVAPKENVEIVQQVRYMQSVCRFIMFRTKGIFINSIFLHIVRCRGTKYEINRTLHCAVVASYAPMCRIWDTVYWFEDIERDSCDKL